MSAAIDLFGAVYTTAGGARYHADAACYALANGRGTAAYRAGEGLYGEALYGAQHLDGLYPLHRRSTISAVQHSYTACRVCVPSEQAMQPMPLVTFSYGHEPVGFCGVWYCARCDERRRDHRGREVYRPVPWPCTSALVLGLAPRGGEAA